MKFRRPRFGLRTLFLLTLAAALGLTWYTRPIPFDERLADGAVIRRYGRRTAEGAVVHSHYVLYDAQGRTLCRGSLAGGGNDPSGTWTLRYPDGRLALSGPCRLGGRAGTWTAWDRDGRRSTVPHAEPLVQHVSVSVNDHPFTPAPMQQQLVLPQREGRARFARDDGQFTDVTFTADAATAQRPATDTAELGQRLASYDLDVVTRALPPAIHVGRDAVPHLVSLLPSRDAIRRRLALESLTRIGPDAASALPSVQPLFDDSEELVRWAALQAAFALDSDAEARDALVRRMQQFVIDPRLGQSDRIPARIAEMAAWGPVVIPVLADFLAQPPRADEDLGERFVAVSVLGVMLQDLLNDHQPRALRGNSPQSRSAISWRSLYDWRQVTARRPEFRRTSLPQALAEILERASRSPDEYVAAAARSFLPSSGVTN